MAKKWGAESAFGVDNLIETLGWVEEELKAVVFQVVLVYYSPETLELYRVVWYKEI